MHIPDGHRAQCRLRRNGSTAFLPELGKPPAFPLPCSLKQNPPPWYWYFLLICEGQVNGNCPTSYFQDADTLISCGVECLLRPRSVQVTQIYADLRLHLRVNFCRDPAQFIPFLSRLPTFPLACPASAHPAAPHAQPHTLRLVAGYVGGGLGCCWLLPAGAWLLKYIIYEILHRKERKVKVTMSLRTLRSLR